MESPTSTIWGQKKIRLGRLPSAVAFSDVRAEDYILTKVAISIIL